MDIGRRASVDDGNRASIRMSSRLIRKYPDTQIWFVHWSTIVNGKAVKTNTLYDNWQNSLRRDYVEGVSKTPSGSEGSDGVLKKDIYQLARKSGSFSDISKIVLSRQNY